MIMCRFLYSEIVTSIAQDADFLVTVILNGAMGLVFIITYVSLQPNVKYSLNKV